MEKMELTKSTPITSETYKDAIQPCINLALNKAKRYGSSVELMRNGSILDLVMMKLARNRTLPEDDVKYYDEIVDSINFLVYILIRESGKEFVKRNAERHSDYANSSNTFSKLSKKDKRFRCCHCGQLFKSPVAHTCTGKVERYKDLAFIERETHQLVIPEIFRKGDPVIVYDYGRFQKPVRGRFLKYVLSLGFLLSPVAEIQLLDQEVDSIVIFTSQLTHNFEEV